MSANDGHALKTILEAEAYPGPSSLALIVIVSHMNMIHAMVSSNKTWL
jgi:hypothetical protein